MIAFKCGDIDRAGFYSFDLHNYSGNPFGMIITKPRELIGEIWCNFPTLIPIYCGVAELTSQKKAARCLAQSFSRNACRTHCLCFVFHAPDHEIVGGVTGELFGDCFYFDL